MPKIKPAESVRRFRKRLYDMDYRERNAKRIKKKKAAHFQATYDPSEAAKKRKERMPYHVEYCRRPEYVEKKHAYDMRHRYQKLYGEFWEAMQIVAKIQKKVCQLIPDKYERTKMRGHILRTMRNNAIRNGWMNRSCLFQEEL